MSDKQKMEELTTSVNNLVNELKNVNERLEKIEKDLYYVDRYLYRIKLASSGDTVARLENLNYPRIFDWRE